jgi:hypothetical protein
MSWQPCSTGYYASRTIKSNLLSTVDHTTVCTCVEWVSYRSRVLLSGCAYNPTGRKRAPINKMRLIMNCFWSSSFGMRFTPQVELEGRADFLEEDFSGRLIKNSWRALNSGGALQSELCLISCDYGISECYMGLVSLKTTSTWWFLSAKIYMLSTSDAHFQHMFFRLW